MSVTGVDGGRWRIGRYDAVRVKGTQSTVGHGKDSGSCSEWDRSHVRKREER